MRRLPVLVALATLLGGWTHGKPPYAQNNLVGFYSTDFPEMNILTSGALSGSGSWPGTLDANNYPNNGILSGNINVSGIQFPPTYASTNWILDWTGECGATSGSPGFQLAPTGTASPRITVISGSSFVSGSTASALNTYGTNGSVTFSLAANALNSANQATFRFQVATYSSCANARLYRSTDATAINATACKTNYQCATPEFVAAVQALHLGWLRTMNFEQSVANSNLTSTTYAPPPGAISYFSNYWSPAAWAGTISCSCSAGTDSYSATLAGATLVDGLTIQGNIASANTGTAPTLTLNSGTAVPITQLTATPVNAPGTPTAGTITAAGTSGTNGTYDNVSLTGGTGAGAVAGSIVVSGGGVTSVTLNVAGWSYVVNDILTASIPGLSGFQFKVTAVNAAASITAVNGTFTYNALLNQFNYQSNGIQAGAPLAAVAGIVSQVNGPGLWYNFPCRLVETLDVNGKIPAVAITSTLTTYLNSNLKFGASLCDELWNFAYSTSNWYAAQGLALGFPIGNEESILSFYGLRTAQIWTDALTVAPSATFYGISESRFSANTTGAPFDLPYRWEGQDLVNNLAYPSVATITIASPAVVTTATNYGWNNNWPVVFSTTGALPTGLVAGTTYYIVNGNYSGGALNGTVFNVAATPGGTPINTSGSQSGTQTITYTNTLYASAINANYSVKPNRPIDIAATGGNGHAIISPAAYASGNQCGGSGSITGVGSTFAGLSGAADNFAAGDTTDAFAFFVSDLTTLGAGTNTLPYWTANYLPNWETSAVTLSASVGKTVNVVYYEGAPTQCQPPTVAQCTAMTGGGGPAANPLYYCGNVWVSGYSVSDSLTTTITGLTGFTYQISTVASGGTPLTGTITNPGSGGTNGTYTAQALNYVTSGSGTNLTATVVVSGGAVTSVSMNSALIAATLIAWKQSSSYQTYTTSYLNTLINASYPHTLGAANYLLSAALPNDWMLYPNNIFATPYTSYNAFAGYIP